MLGKIEGRRRMGQDVKMVRWHNRLNEHEFEEAPEDGEVRGSPACYRSWGHKELDMTED